VHGIATPLGYHRSKWFYLGFYVDGFGAAFLGALIVSIVSVILTILIRGEARVEKRGQ
jgi:uncharacterized membrane protein YvlD (DUF360 family)